MNTSDTNNILLDFQMDFLMILSEATLLYESYSFDSRDSCLFFLNTNCTNDTNIILLDFEFLEILSGATKNKKLLYNFIVEREY